MSYRPEEMPPAPNPQPSEKQLEVLRFLIAHVEKSGYQPTQAEMAEALGVTRTAVSDRLKELEKRGFVRLARGDRERAITICHVRFVAVVGGTGGRGTDAG